MGNIHYSANSASVPHYATYPPPPSLGTFVYPNSPFPLDITPTLPNQSASIPTYSLTIYIPAAQLLTSIPTVVPLWGSQDTSGDGDVAGGYTDDSDIRLAVLHAAFVSLDEMRRAKKEERDLKVEFVWRGVRTRFRGSVGGVGRRAGAKRAWSEDAEGVVRSAGWGTSHDGGALEIVRTEWVEKGTAYALHRPNRKSRIAQYTQQRARLNLLPPQPPSLADPPAINALPPFPSSAFRSGSPSSVSSSLVATPRDVSAGPVEMDLEDGEREGAMLNVVFGYGAEEGARFMLTPASSEDRYTLSVLSAPLSTQQVSKADVGFTDEGVCFWSSTSADHEGGDNDAIARKLGGARHRDGQRTGWFCTVKRWRFATAQEVEAAASNSSDSS
ncbi:hypothetical protein BOTBODRAFT_36783 [Botryobasidium botryosum FD-172 SS1]|uniref:Uncharacterized protein n=1 Tax=Botryobasidium botryosum (strain FD-172 SS1) TaxID=930990 RepID=A0A067MDY3_BOTB1|nr:hypothetical protein BOTBODRAFT_36783 [Botryobasidium botryosum FD-172 SS1]